MGIIKEKRWRKRGRDRERERVQDPSLYMCLHNEGVWLY